MEVNIMNNDSRKLTEEKRAIKSLIRDKASHGTIVIKRDHLPLLQEAFPNSSLVPAFPSLEEDHPSLEDYFSDETTSSEERALLQHADALLPDFAKELCSEDDEMVVSFYPKN